MYGRLELHVGAEIALNFKIWSVYDERACFKMLLYKLLSRQRCGGSVVKGADCGQMLQVRISDAATFYERNYFLHEKLPFTREVTFCKRNYENFQFNYNYKPGEVTALSFKC